MKLNKIDLKNVMAAGYDQEELVLLIDRGNEIEYLEIPAPRAAYEGLKQLADYTNGTRLYGEKEAPQSHLRQQPIPLFVDESGVFNRVKNLSNSQPRLRGEYPEAMGDEPSQTWQMLGNVNFTRQ